MRRTAIVNQIRGLLLERGITLRKGRRYVDAALPGILEDATAQLSGALRILLAQLKLETRSDGGGGSMRPMPCFNKTARENAACQRLLAIPALDQLPQLALIAAIGTGAASIKGREFAAWMGIVHANTHWRQAKSCSESANEGTPTCEHCSFHGARAVHNKGPSRPLV